MSFSKLFGVLVAKIFHFLARGEKAETLKLVEGKNSSNEPSGLCDCWEVPRGVVLGNIPRSETLPASLPDCRPAFDDCSLLGSWKQQVKVGSNVLRVLVVPACQRRLFLHPRCRGRSRALLELRGSCVQLSGTVQSLVQMVELAVASDQCECVFFCIYCWEGDVPV